MKAYSFLLEKVSGYDFFWLTPSDINKMPFSQGEHFANAIGVKLADGEKIRLQITVEDGQA